MEQEGQAVRPPGFDWRRAGVVGTVVVSLVIAGILYTSLKAQRKNTESPAPVSVVVGIRTSPPGAAVLINNELKCTSNCSLRLPPGLHQVQAALAGHETAVTTLSVTPGIPTSVDLLLDPVPPAVRVYTDLPAGKVLLDGVLIGELQEGQLILDRIRAGKHSLRVEGAAGETEFTFNAEGARTPVVEGPVAARNVLAIVAGNYGAEARLYSSEPKLKVSLGGADLGEVPPEGLVLSNLQGGDSTLLVGDGARQRKLLLSTAAKPTLTAFLKLDLNAGTLVVVTGVDNVSLFLNEKEYRRGTQRGQLRMPGLAVGTYSVRVAKEGFQPESARQVEIHKGEEVRLEFQMRSLPKVASLRIRGAAPGTVVLMDDAMSGTVESDGTFSAAGVAPGERQIELRLRGYAPRRLSRVFRAGETMELSEAETAMERATGTVRLRVTPAESRLTLRRSEDVEGRPVQGAVLTLVEGLYTLAARAPGYLEKSVTLQVIAGETKSIDLELEKPKPPPPKEMERVGTMLDWEQPGAWALDGSWQVRKGGNYVFYRMTPTAGVWTFHAALFRGKRIQWFFACTDPKNYVLYQLDKKNLTRRVVVNGKGSETKTVHGQDKQESWQFRVEVTADGIVHQIRAGDTWRMLDQYSAPGRNLGAGRFGMYISGGDEFGLADFRFQPK